MRLIDIDFRYDWTSLILHALKSGSENLRRKRDEEAWFDGIWQKENIETILGIAYVSVQAYILGVVEDVNEVRNSVGKEKLNKLACYSDDPNPLPNGTSRVQLINSLANYYKHHDEWKNWPRNPTTQVLADVGIFADTEFPCYRVTTILWNENNLENLENLLSIISEWRKYILSKYL